MNPSARASLGFLLVGFLGAIVGALLVGFFIAGNLQPKPAGPSTAGTINVASATPLGKLPDGDLEQRIINTVKRSLPSVVLIKSTVHGVQRFYNPFNDPFGDSGSGVESRPFTARASGSGFIIKRDGDTGYVATNAHVVYHADKIQVLLSNGRQVEASVVGSDIHDDVALLKIKDSNLPPALPVGDSNALQQGQFVLAIGEPENFQNSVSLGIVANLHRPNIEVGGQSGLPPIRYTDLIQITTPINPGNSGGPLLTDTGEVVGINAIVAAGAQAIGFAIPMKVANPILADIEHGRFVEAQRPFIGVQMRGLDDQIRNYLNYRGKSGVVVAGVVDGSPASTAGLQQGDVIVEVNHQKVSDPEDVRKVVNAHKVGDRVALLVWRDGNLEPINVTLANQNNFIGNN